MMKLYVNFLREKLLNCQQIYCTFSTLEVCKGLMDFFFFFHEKIFYYYILIFFICSTFMFINFTIYAHNKCLQEEQKRFEAQLVNAISKFL